MRRAGQGTAHRPRHPGARPGALWQRGHCGAGVVRSARRRRPDGERRRARDRYGRRLEYVWYKGRMVNWDLVRHGWGVTLHYQPNVRYAALLDAAQARAQAEGRGLWRIEGFRCQPKAHRAREC
ncbi:MAG: thermonuclease family protein [Gemmatimonadetes bacterium]|nr:thermonuclease family protein [Gemmatimonadota bacterium]